MDHNRRNLELLSQFIDEAGYRIVAVASLGDLEPVLANPEEIKLALVDVSGFDPSIWERCDRLRKRGIPFLVLSSRQSRTLQKLSLEHGARGVLVKPLLAKELLALIRSMLGE